MLKLAEVKWAHGGMAFECPECGGKTHFSTFAPFIRCSHCGDVYKMPGQIEVKPVKPKQGATVAEGM